MRAGGSGHDGAVLPAVDAAAAAAGARSALWRLVPPQAGEQAMTSLPAASSPRKLGLVIDLDICVGCHACAVACKEWNDGGQFGPLPAENPYGREPLGVWFNRVHTYEVAGDDRRSTVDVNSADHIASTPHVDRP